MTSPIFRSVGCLFLAAACKILAAFHLIGSIIYIVLGAVKLSDVNQEKYTLYVLVPYTIVIIFNILNGSL